MKLIFNLLAALFLLLYGPLTHPQRSPSWSFSDQCAGTGSQHSCMLPFRCSSSLIFVLAWVVSVLLFIFFPASIFWVFYVLSLILSCSDEPRHMVSNFTLTVPHLLMLLLESLPLRATVTAFFSHILNLSITPDTVILAIIDGFRWRESFECLVSSSGLGLVFLSWSIMMLSLKFS